MNHFVVGTGFTAKAAEYAEISVVIEKYCNSATSAPRR
jgi:hypothetical protein